MWYGLGACRQFLAMFSLAARAKNYNVLEDTSTIYKRTFRVVKILFDGILTYSTSNTNHAICNLEVIYFLDLCEAFEGCTDKPCPESHGPGMMYDMKKWLKAHSRDLHKHVEPYCFKFLRNQKGKQ